LKEKLQEKFKRAVYGFATHVVPVSAAGKRDAIDVYGVPPYRCNFVFHTCRPDPRRLIVGTVPRRKPNVKHIVNLGRLYPSKGVDTLLHALRTLQDRNPTWPIKLTQIGSGPSLNQLQQLAKDLNLGPQVEFVGHLPQAEAFSRLAVADVLALPIRSDPGPGAIPEGLGLGIPVIACAVGGIAELFQSTEAVRLVPVDDTHAFADALEEILRDPELAKRMSKAARKLFEEKFHLDHWVRDVHSWLECSVFASISDRGLWTYDCCHSLQPFDKSRIHSAFDR